MAGVFEKLTSLLFKPSKFFRIVDKEKGYWPTVLFFIILFAVYEIIDLALSGIISSTQNLVKLSELPKVALLFVISVAFAFVFSFIYSGFMHLGVLVFGGKEGFLNTFKVATNSLVIFTLYYLLLLILSTAFFFSNPFDLTKLGVEGVKPFEVNRLSITTIAISFAMLLVTIAAYVHSIYTESVGISKLQGFNFGKAFLSVIIGSLIATPIYLLVKPYLGIG